MFSRRLFNVPTWGFSRAFRDFDRLQRQMNELYGALSGGTLPMPAAGVFPLTNVTEDNDHYYVRAELPGIKSGDLDIQVTAKGISISGERKIPEEGNNVRYHRKEREAGRFSRSINLPDDINVDKIDAKLINGVLTIIIPKAEKTKPRQIAVQ